MFDTYEDAQECIEAFLMVGGNRGKLFQIHKVQGWDW